MLLWFQYGVGQIPKEWVTLFAAFNNREYLVLWGFSGKPHIKEKPQAGLEMVSQRKMLIALADSSNPPQGVRVPQQQRLIW